MILHSEAAAEGRLQELKLEIVEVLLERIVRLVLLLVQFSLDRLIKTLLQSILALCLSYLEVLLAGLGGSLFDVFFKFFKYLMKFPRTRYRSLLFELFYGLILKLI